MAVVAVELLPERNCAKCTASQRIEYGCNGNARLPVKWDGQELTTCPRRPILDDPFFYGEVFQSYRYVGRGFLPSEGSIESQPNVLVEAWAVIDRALDQVEEHKEKERKRKSRARKTGA